jgi:hypothetical protein
MIENCEKLQRICEEKKLEVLIDADENSDSDFHDQGDNVTEQVDVVIML